MSRTPGFPPRRWRRSPTACLVVAGLALFAAVAAADQPAPAGQKAAPAPASGEPYRITGAIEKPMLVHRPYPKYTEEAQRARIAGMVIVEAVIDERGDVIDTRVVKPLPLGLDRSATAVVATWKFEPATLGGEPVKVYYLLTVNFQVAGAVYQGPVFTAFLKEHGDFREALRGRRWDEAAAFLGRLPENPETGVARTYLLLHQDRLAEAWQAARGYTGGHWGELLRAVTDSALQLAQDWAGDAGKSAAAVALGLETADLAIAAAPDDFEVILTKSELLRLRAQQADDDAERQRLLDEKDRLRAWAAEMIKARYERSAEVGAPR